ncbi:MAG: hypothetical protein ACO1OX_10245 [Novosphingobium sp.]
MEHAYYCSGPDAESFDQGKAGAELHDFKPTFDGLVSQQRFEKFSLAGKASVDRCLADVSMAGNTVEGKGFEPMIPQDFPPCL